MLVNFPYIDIIDYRILCLHVQNIGMYTYQTRKSSRTFYQCLTFMPGQFQILSLLVGCFGFNGPLRQYSVYIGPSPKEREKEKRKDR